MNLAARRQSLIRDIRGLKARHRKRSALQRILVKLTTKLIRQELRHDRSR